MSLQTGGLLYTVDQMGTMTVETVQALGQLFEHGLQQK